MRTEFFIVWQNENGGELSREYIIKEGIEKAVRSACIRFYQSRHLCPPSAAGFYVTDGAEIGAKIAEKEAKGLTPSPAQRLQEYIENSGSPED